MKRRVLQAAALAVVTAVAATLAILVAAFIVVSEPSLCDPADVDYGGQPYRC